MRAGAFDASSQLCACQAIEPLCDFVKISMATVPLGGKVACCASCAATSFCALPEFACSSFPSSDEMASCSNCLISALHRCSNSICSSASNRPGGARTCVEVSGIASREIRLRRCFRMPLVSPCQPLEPRGSLCRLSLLQLSSDEMDTTSCCAVKLLAMPAAPSH